MSDIFSIVRIIIGTAILAIASLNDLRTRTVSNMHWVVMGSLGILILAIEILTSSIEGEWNPEPGLYNMNHLLALVPTIILFYDIFWDRDAVYEEGKINFTALIVMGIGLLSAIGLFWIEGVNIQTLQLLIVPLMIIVGYIFFYTGLLHGGADAKGFMSIAILVPFSPIIGDILPLVQYPAEMVEIMSTVFPYAFLTLMNASLIVAMFFPLAMFIKNLARKDLQFPAMFFGYRMEIKDIPGSFVWPMECVKDGELVIRLFPKRNSKMKEELDKLKEMGLEDTWVNPQLPFVVYMFLGFIFSFIVGNVMTYLYGGF